MMQKIYLIGTAALVSLFASAPIASVAQSDTTWVQAYTWEEQNDPATAYDSPGRRWFDFPSSENGESYQKILMYYTLKCFEDGTAGNLGYDCGEWDYLTYNYLYDHTGLLDSNMFTHPLQLVDDLDFEVDTLIFQGDLGAVNAPHDTVRYSWPVTGYDTATATEAVAQETILDLTMIPQQGVRRLQFVWTAEELTALGLEAGQIQQIDFPTEVVPGGGHLEVRSQWVQGVDTLATLVDDGWTTLGMANMSAGGSTILAFEEALMWDGASDLMLECLMRVEGSLLGVMPQMAATSAPGRTRMASGAGRFVRFDGNDRFEVEVDLLADISGEVTMEFWQRGAEEFQPENNSVCEGANASGGREINIHLPWSNGNVYWDAGNDGGYDRIYAAAQPSDYEGNWNHWAFTKDAVAGEMAIYLNGELWLAGVDRDNFFGEMVRFYIGCNASGGNDYRGDVDAFRIFAAAMDAETIAEWMDEPVTSAHPYYESLAVNFDFDGTNGTNPSAADGTGWFHGNAGRFEYEPRDAFWQEMPVPGDARPAVAFWQGATATGEDSVETYDVAYPVPPTSHSTWEVTTNAVEWTSLAYGWPVETASETRSVDGEVLATYALADQVGSAAEVTVTNGELIYYGEPFDEVNRYEIGRYITPYGINLTLDDDGWTWVYDVTDYAPLLRDSVELEAGNWQELLDMRFAFIEGTPAREVQRVERLWNGTIGLSTFDANIMASTFTPEDNETMFRMKTRASGHGFGTGNNCGEFCYNTHSIQVNGDLQWSWEIMRECADNALYPQGGTWIYDRAAWCPGAVVDTKEFELTPLVSGQEAFTVDYDITYDPYGNYRFEGQIIAYSDPYFQYEVEISEVLSPSDFKLYSRTNPICSSPQVLIRNNGAETLTSCTFTYGVEGGEEATYDWTGELPFLGTEVVDLSYSDPVLQEGDEAVLTFNFSVAAPNGMTDEQPSNNVTSSRFTRVPTFAYDELDDNRMIVWLKTNSTPWETSALLTDDAGEVIWESTYSDANTIHRDTLALNQGCYTFTVFDADDDGLSFWANSDGGGYARLKRVSGGNFHYFESDFGKSIQQSFFFATNIVGVEESGHPAEVIPTALLFPNPASDFLQVKLTGWQSGAEVLWSLRDALGRIVLTGATSHVLGRLVSIDVSELPAGAYAWTAPVEDGVVSQWVVVK